jgi:hypothetical protein
MKRIPAPIYFAGLPHGSLTSPLGIAVARDGDGLAAKLEIGYLPVFASA